jgi:glycine/D-amino acid oxidase-like deaminating enzyme/nitrite reductase/ring-hydroxylating ferredoxin subunit
VSDFRPSLPHRPESVWRANPGAPSFVPLDDDRRCEVVVVGAGIAGLSAALLLARAGRDVVVLDAHAVGDGVTGVTTAKASVLQSTRYSMIEDAHGASVARRYAEANMAGQEQLRRWIEELAPDARLQLATAVTATTEPSSATKIEKEAEAAGRAGLPVELHGPGADLGLPFELAAAVSLPDQVHFDPIPYLWALARAVEEAGGRVHEHSRVTGLAGLDGHGVVTPAGTVTADHIIATTGIPIFDRAGWFARAYPSRSYVIAAALGEGVTVPMDGYYGIDTPSWSLRPATDPRDGRILLVAGGGSHVPGREPHPIAEQKRLAAWLANRFDGVEVRYRWSAQDYEVSDMLPAYGPMWALPTRVLVATGFNKWGMTNGTAAALALAGMVTGERPPWAEPFDTPRFHPRVGAKPFVTANAEVAAHLVKDWITGGPSKAPDTGPRTPAADARAGGADARAEASAERGEASAERGEGADAERAEVADAHQAGTDNTADATVEATVVGEAPTQGEGLETAAAHAAAALGGAEQPTGWGDAPVTDDPATVAPPPLGSGPSDTATTRAAVAAASGGDELSSDPHGLQEGQGVVIRRGLDRVGVAKVDGELKTVRAVCTHMAGVLAWNDAECSWDCPLHGSRFDADGRMLQGPACRDLQPRTV